MAYATSEWQEKESKFTVLSALVKDEASVRRLSREEMLRFARDLQEVEPSDNALKVAESRYFRRDGEGNVCEDWPAMLERVSRDVATGENGDVDEELAFIFCRLMAAGLFFPNSPTLMNAGTPVQQLQACFVLPIEDSMESIFETLKHSALIQKSGGGIGYFIGKIRHKGAIVSSTGGQASGPLSFLSIYNKVSNEIRQGGRRRGASLATLQHNHPDIMEFIDSKRESGELSNFNISVRVDDEFMQALLEDKDYDLIDPSTGKTTGTKLRAGDVFDRIIENSHLNGEPGLLFYDAINKDNPTPHLGSIDATNPCITGDMRVSTERGLETMSSICERGKARVATDDRVLSFVQAAQAQQGGGRGVVSFSARSTVTLRTAVRFYRQGRKHVFLLKTRSGYSLKATAEHPVLTLRGWVPLGDIRLDDCIFIQPGRGFFNKDDDLPFNIDNNIKGKNGRVYRFNFPRKWSRQLGEVIGWLVGDGWLRLHDKEQRVGFCFGPADGDALKYIKAILDYYYGHPVQEITRKNGRMHLSYHSRFMAGFFASLGVKAVPAAQKTVPDTLFTATEEAVCGFLRALFSADGTARFAPGKSAYIRLTSKSSSLLEGVQLLLLNLGMKSSLYQRHRKRRHTFNYRTVAGEERRYHSDGILYELQVSRDSLPLFLKKVGFLGEKNAAVIEDFKKQSYYADRFMEKIREIIPLGEDIVYDLQEPVTRSFIANGIVVHNCGEQPLLPYESCNLGSINLARMLKKEGERFVPDLEKIRLTAHIATIFLDRVLDRNRAPIPQIEEMMRGNRKIGLGIMGLAQYLIRREIPYNSEEGFAAAQEVMREIAIQSKVASWQLAEERGEFPNFKGSLWDILELPQRNATTTTIAPTGSLSIFANASPSAEPLFGVGFARNIMDGRFVQLDPLFLEMWRERFGKEPSPTLLDKIGELGPHGIQGIEEIHPDFRRLFLCAHDIPPLDHIRMQTVLQQWVDNAVSKTINAPGNATPDDCRTAFLQAWRSGAKGITYYRDGSREHQVITAIAEKPSKAQPAVTKGKVPRERPETTYGQTTRKPIGFCGRLYVTVNKEIMEDGEERICEVFTSVGEEGCPPLSNALAKIISISIRAGVDINKIVEKLREEKCPSCIMHPDTTVLSCTDFIGQEIAKAATGKVTYRLNAAGGPKGIRTCPSCRIGYMIPDALCSYCEHCGFSTCG
ncbi:MAG: LAGLIDADG family homing endonuclease [Bacillota bacterium]